MKRIRLNFWIDAVNLIILLGLGFTGCIMRYILPPGSGGLGRQFHGGRGREEEIRDFLSLTRHEWGSIHFYIAAVFLLLMLLHITLHWTWIKNCFKSFFGKKTDCAADAAERK